MISKAQLELLRYSRYMHLCNSCLHNAWYIIYTLVVEHQCFVLVNVDIRGYIRSWYNVIPIYIRMLNTSLSHD